jgi:hypothetical protein
METLIFLTPFAVFFIILIMAHFHLNSLAIFTTGFLIIWTICAPLAAHLVAANKKDKNKF